MIFGQKFPKAVIVSVEKISLKQEVPLSSVSQFSLEKILVRPAFVSAFAYLSPNHGDFGEDNTQCYITRFYYCFPFC